MVTTSLEEIRWPRSGRMLLCLEVNPPRGVDLEPVFDRLSPTALKGVDFLNVTDSALARMKLAALPFASLLKVKTGIEPLVNLSCRDRNLIALQADLLAGWATGVRSVVALTGDAVTVGDAPETKGVFEINSVGLLHAIEMLNSGKDLVGNELKGAPHFFPGVVVNPNVKNASAEIRRLERKQVAGARYALSQPVFDIDNAVTFFKQASAVGIPIFMGLLPFKNLESARSLSSVPGIRMADDLLSKVEQCQAEKIPDFSVDHCLRVAEAGAPYVCGFHVVSGASPKLALRLSSRLAGWLGGVSK